MAYDTLDHQVEKLSAWTECDTNTMSVLRKAADTILTGFGTGLPWVSGRSRLAASIKATFRSDALIKIMSIWRSLANGSAQRGSQGQVAKEAVRTEESSPELSSLSRLGTSEAGEGSCALSTSVSDTTLESTPGQEHTTPGQEPHTPAQKARTSDQSSPPSQKCSAAGQGSPPPGHKAITPHTVAEECAQCPKQGAEPIQCTNVPSAPAREKISASNGGDLCREGATREGVRTLM